MTRKIIVNYIFFSISIKVEKLDEYTVIWKYFGNYKHKQMGLGLRGSVCVLKLKSLLKPDHLVSFGTRLPSYELPVNPNRAPGLSGSHASLVSTKESPK